MKRCSRSSGRKNWRNSSPVELTNDQREYLLGLPLPEMEDQLRQMYMRSQVGLRDGDWRGGFGRPGDWSRRAGDGWTAGLGS